MPQIKKFLSKKGISFILLLSIVTIFVYLLFGKDYGFVRVHGESMLPTYKDGNDLVYQIDYPFHRNSVVVIYVDGEKLIKRIIALEGEHVEIKHGRIFINGKEHKDKYSAGEITYWLESEEVRIKKPKKEWLFFNVHENIGLIPKGYVFVIGDNRQISWYGIAQKNNIKGTVIW